VPVFSPGDVALHYDRVRRGPVVVLLHPKSWAVIDMAKDWRRVFPLE
jgi:hypothetical protein